MNPYIRVAIFSLSNNKQNCIKSTSARFLMEWPMCFFVVVMRPVLRNG